MIVVNMKEKDDIRIVSTVPLSDQQDYPMLIHFVKDGRKYAAIADDKNLMAAAEKSLSEQRVPFEDLCDVMQCVLFIIDNQSNDFYGREKYRDAFREEANIPWSIAVYNILHDIVSYRLHKFFHYGDGLENLCVYQDIMTKISFPCKSCSQPL